MSVSLQLPESAPFTAAQRHWLNGFLAGVLSGQDVAQTADEGQPDKRGRVPIFYGSQSGNAESLAEQFAEMLLAAGYDAPVINMQDHEEIDLADEKVALLISSTWGDGDPPDNAVEFWNKLASVAHPRLEQLQFAVCGLGDSNYLDFCGMGKRLDARLAELGARRLADRADCDVDFEDTAAQWFDATLNALGSATGTLASTGNEKAPPSVRSVCPAYSKKRPFPAQLVANRLLNAAESNRDTRHFEFDLAGSGLTYEVGDVLGVYPKNDPALVEELLEKLSLRPAEPVPTPDGSEDKPLREALIADYDIRTVNSTILDAWPAKIEPRRDFHELIDLVEASPATFSHARDFVRMLRKLNPRLYSISSSPKAHPDEVHLTVAKVTYALDGRARQGVCSTYLSDRVNGDGSVPIFLQTAKHFKLPSDGQTAVIMVGPGTGVAPFRAFLEEREATHAPGKNWLFFGNAHEATDWFYREQFAALIDKGILTRLSTAWSRDQEEKVYVQDRMRESAQELWIWLEEGAHLYVCGDAKRMAKDVDRALHDLIQTEGKRSADAAAEYVAALKKTKRYQRDVY